MIFVAGYSCRLSLLLILNVWMWGNIGTEVNKSLIFTCFLRRSQSHFRLFHDDQTRINNDGVQPHLFLLMELFVSNQTEYNCVLQELLDKNKSNDTHAFVTHTAVRMHRVTIHICIRI